MYCCYILYIFKALVTALSFFLAVNYQAYVQNYQKNFIHLELFLKTLREKND